MKIHGMRPNSDESAIEFIIQVTPEGSTSINLIRASKLKSSRCRFTEHICRKSKPWRQLIDCDGDCWNAFRSTVIKRRLSDSWKKLSSISFWNLDKPPIRLLLYISTYSILHVISVLDWGWKLQRNLYYDVVKNVDISCWCWAKFEEGMKLRVKRSSRFCY